MPAIEGRARSGVGPRRLVGPQSIAVILVLTVVLYAFLLRTRAREFQGNLSGFICIGENVLPAELLPEKTWTFPGLGGYDGQYYYLVARDPFLTKGLYRHADDAAYRYQRIIYPLLAGLFSFGKVSLIPAMLLLINVLAVLGGIIILGLMLRENGMNVWYALCYPFLSGFLLAVLRDLTEPTAAFFMVAALYFYGRRRYLPFSLLMSCAILAREISAVLIPILLVDAYIIKRNRTAGLATVLSTGGYALWSAYLYLRLGQAPWHGGRQNFAAPFEAMVRYAADLFGRGHVHSNTDRYFFVLFSLAAVLGLMCAFRALRHALDEVSLGLLAFSLLPFLMSSRVWVEPWSYSRVLVMAPVFLLLSFAKTGGRLCLVPLAFHVLTTVIVMIQVVRHGI